MVDFQSFRKLALSFPDTEELPHFDLASFRVRKKIFATYHAKTNRAMLKLSLVSQSVFCDYNSSIFFPVPGGWGLNGATFVELSKVPKSIFKEALSVAYNELVSTKNKPLKKGNKKDKD
jgi:hypothetical protein